MLVFAESMTVLLVSTLYCIWLHALVKFTCIEKTGKVTGTWITN